jgi:hypothetical protein
MTTLEIIIVLVILLWLAGIIVPVAAVGNGVHVLLVVLVILLLVTIGWRSVERKRRSASGALTIASGWWADPTVDVRLGSPSVTRPAPRPIRQPSRRHRLGSRCGRL